MSDDEADNVRFVEIDLRKQNLTILDQGIFRQYPHANRVLLTDNKISEIEDNAFDNIQNITSLYLNNNRLLRIDRAIQRQQNLRVLHLRSNRIREIDANTFERLEQLRVLRLSNNNLANVSPLCLLPLRNLTRLSLTNTNIGPLAPPFFNANLNLRELYLDNCGLEIAPGLFRCLRKLKSLDLSGNSLTELPSGIFHGLRSLQYLKVENNLLSELPDDLLADCEQLLLINLSENNLESLSGDFFVRNPLLQAVDLYACSSRLNVTEGIFRECPLVSHVSIGACERMPIGSLIELKNLFIEPSLSENGDPLTIVNNLHQLLSQAPRSISMLQLRKCRLQRRHLDIIIRRLQRIRILTLSEITFDNNADGICLTDQLFANLVLMTELTIRRSPLPNFNSNLFGRHNSLKNLTLSGCELFTLQARYFKYLDTLECFVLDDNYFVEVLSGDVFIHLENLQELSMCNCEMIQLPRGLFERNRRLKSVCFENNPIVRFNYDAVFCARDGYQQLRRISVWESTAIDGMLPARLVIRRVPHEYSSMSL